MSAVDHPAPPSLPELPDGVQPAERRARWPAWAAWVSLLAAFGAALFFAVIIGVVAVPFGATLDNPPPSVNLLATFAQDGCMIGAALFFARTVAPPRPWQFGLRPTTVRTALTYIVGGYLAFFVFSFVWLQLIGQPDTSDDIAQQLGANKSTVASIFVALLVCVAAPLTEEFFFRGWFFGAMRNWRGVWPAAVVTGIVFGGVHVTGSPIAFIVPLAFFGAVLCLIYERTGSLYPCIALHCVNNSIALGSSLHWDWQVPVTLVSSLTVIAGVLTLIRRVAGPDRLRPAPA